MKRHLSLALIFFAILGANSNAASGFNLLDPAMAKKFLPPGFDQYVDQNIGLIQQAVSGKSSTAITGGAVTAAPAIPAVPVIPLPTASALSLPPIAPASTFVSTSTTGSLYPQTNPAYNPYMPNNGATAAPTASSGTIYPNSGASSGQQNVSSHINSNSNIGGPVNPFTNQVVEVAPVNSNIVLEADLDANPVFHPPFQSAVPEYPPIEGMHWYQFHIPN